MSGSPSFPRGWASRAFHRSRAAARRACEDRARDLRGGAPARSSRGGTPPTPGSKVAPFTVPSPPPTAKNPSGSPDPFRPASGASWWPECGVPDTHIPRGKPVGSVGAGQNPACRTGQTRQNRPHGAGRTGGAILGKHARSPRRTGWRRRRKPHKTRVARRGQTKAHKNAQRARLCVIAPFQRQCRCLRPRQCPCLILGKPGAIMGGCAARAYAVSVSRIFVLDKHNQSLYTCHQRTEDLVDGTG